MPELRERAQHLVALKSSPSWPIVKEIIEARIEHQFKRFTSPEKLDEQDMNYARGFISGLLYVVELIQDAEKTFERAIVHARKREDNGTTD